MPLLARTSSRGRALRPGVPNALLIPLPLGLGPPWQDLTLDGNCLEAEGIRVLHASVRPGQRWELKEHRYLIAVASSLPSFARCTRMRGRIPGSSAHCFVLNSGIPVLWGGLHILSMWLVIIPPPWVIIREWPMSHTKICFSEEAQ